MRSWIILGLVIYIIYSSWIRGNECEKITTITLSNPNIVEISPKTEVVEKESIYHVIKNKFIGWDKEYTDWAIQHKPK